jgi:endonuclease III
MGGFRDEARLGAELELQSGERDRLCVHTHVHRTSVRMSLSRTRVVMY